VRQILGGNTLQYNIPTSGLISRLHIQNIGAINALTGTPSIYGQSAFIRTARLRGSVTQDFFNLRGPSYFGIFLPYADFPGNSAMNSTGWTAIASSGAVNLPITVPCTVNDRDTIGLLPAQDRSTLLTYEQEFETNTNLASTSLTMTTEIAARVAAVAFTVPPTADALPPMNALHQIIDRTEAIGATGDYRHDWDRGAVILQKLHGYGFQVTTPADSWDDAKLKLDVMSEIMDIWPNLADQMVSWYRPGIQRRLGIIPFDFWGMSGIGNYDTPRDAIVSWDYNYVQTILHATATGTLYSVVRQIVMS